MATVENLTWELRILKSILLQKIKCRTFFPYYKILYCLQFSYYLQKTRFSDKSVFNINRPLIFEKLFSALQFAYHSFLNVKSPALDNTPTAYVARSKFYFYRFLPNSFYDQILDGKLLRSFLNNFVALNSHLVKRPSIN